MNGQRRRLASQDVAREHGVSLDMVTYRLQVTGVAIQARRLQARRS
jgi:hypothetical protein